MRRYDEAIEVRQGLVGDDEGPAQFLWRRRLWKVIELQTRWVETADWWNSTQVRAARGDGTIADVTADGDDDLYVSPFYDLAKLSHSVVGNYDFINYGLYRVEIDADLDRPAKQGAGLGVADDDLAGLGGGVHTGDECH